MKNYSWNILLVLVFFWVCLFVCFAICMKVFFLAPNVPFLCWPIFVSLSFSIFPESNVNLEDLHSFLVRDIRNRVVCVFVCCYGRESPHRKKQRKQTDLMRNLISL